MKHLSRADRNIRWVQKYCISPSGPSMGQRVYLSDIERQQVRELYAAPGGPQDMAVSGRLGSFLVLLHLVGPEARRDFKGPVVKVDVWTLRRAASPDLQQYLQRHGERIVCPELGTRYPAAA
jgi:hypothetical protein